MIRAATVLALLSPGFLSGCTVGFQSHSLAGKRTAQAPRELGAVSIAYADEKGDCLRELRLPLEKTLRQRHGLFKLQALADVGKKDQDAFLMSITCEPLRRPSSELAFMLSIITFSAVPSTWSRETAIAFKLIAPNGDEKIFRYVFHERTYAWLPLMLLGAGYSEIALGAETDYYQDKRVRILTRMTERLMDDAAPFLLAYSGAK